MQEVDNKNESEALLLVNATDAFYSLNRQVALRNVKILCPNIAEYIENIYKQPSHLYIAGGNREFILSEEETTLGDNCEMEFFAISTVSILKHLHDSTLCDSVWQAWFADDSSATTSLHSQMVLYENIDMSCQGRSSKYLCSNGIFNSTSLEIHTANSTQYVGSVQRPGK